MNKGMMEKIKESFGLSTVRKKVLMLSKVAGVMIVLFYLVTIELSDDSSAAFLIWFCLLIVVILGVDVMLGRMISNPLNEINDTARQMAELDFTAHCDVHRNDEFGELSYSLNVMSENLQEALMKLETANAQLEKDVEQERLLQVQRKELADSLSHEMKTPLGLIRAYTEGLKENPEEAKKEKYIEEILSATDRMNGMIVSLLDLSALEAGAARLSEDRFDFVELAETVAGRLLIDAPGTKHHLTYHLPSEPVYIRCDRQRMEQVLTNLIENARKYVREGGEIRLTVKCAEERLHFSVFNESDAISEQEQEKIWEKFYRCKNEGKGGSGLGLAITAQILSMYDAEYGVENRPGGVEFYFHIDFTSTALSFHTKSIH